MTLRGALAFACVTLVAACATTPSSVVPAHVRVEPAFTADGRMSARRGNDGVAVHFTWQHSTISDDFDVSTPLGQTVARMRRDRNGVRVERPKETPENYADWRALTTAVLGVPIPVDGLALWIQGVAGSQASASVERDSAGRVSLLREQGWEIVYSYGNEGTQPSRLVMTYPGSEPIEVRIVVDKLEPLRMPS